MDIGLKITLTGLIPAVLGFVLAVILELKGDDGIKHYEKIKLGCLRISATGWVIWFVGVLVWIW